MRDSTHNVHKYIQLGETKRLGHMYVHTQFTHGLLYIDRSMAQNPRPSHSHRLCTHTRVDMLVHVRTQNAERLYAQACLCMSVHTSWYYFISFPLRYTMFVGGC